ncbi:hypothetical protein [Agrobacterium sp. M50-1]|uniref:hypothetical protein n=1 Tax=Agrobacterium sp. M50-1 TaxID=3132821 RepID=UPI003CE50D23
MQLPKKSPDAFKWNLNTILQLITLGMTLIVGVTAWVNLNRDNDDMKNWRTSHEELHKERQLETRTSNTRFDERIKVLEDSNIKRDSQIDALTVQLTALKQSQESTNLAIREITSKLNDLVADSRVNREILQRLEASFRNGATR